MSPTTDDADQLASLFVDLTGTDTVTDRQRDADSRRVADAAERAVADDVAAATRDHGLDDAIADPETDD